MLLYSTTLRIKDTLTKDGFIQLVLQWNQTSPHDDNIIPKVCIEEVQLLMLNMGYKFAFRIISNDEFKELILDPILLASDGIADTNELFVRSYQMLQMFEGKKQLIQRKFPVVLQ